MYIVVLLNRHSGHAGGGLRRAILAACARHHISVRLLECDGAALATAARHALAEQPPPDLVVAAGGDGTISAVAGILAFGQVPLGIIPAGTLNHLAKDLHIPLRTEAAVALLAAHEVKRIDLGEVNGRHFVNNSSLGLYPSLVIDRDRQRRRLHRPRWLAQSLAALHVAMRLRILGLTLDFGEGDYRVRTPLLFVGNNEYRVDLRSRFHRSGIAGGQLVTHIVRRDRWWTIFGLLLRLALGQTTSADLETRATTELIVRTRRRRSLRVAMDGEVHRMRPPLHYRILPAALRVAVPPLGLNSGKP